VGARAEQETGVKSPSFPLPHARTVGKAAVRAIKRDKSEIVIFPGPGRLMKSPMDFFPGMGPSMNRMTGTNGLMEEMAIAREQQRERSTAEEKENPRDLLHSG
jgi:hypothetical protein